MKGACARRRGREREIRQRGETACQAGSPGEQSKSHVPEAQTGEGHMAWADHEGLAGQAEGLELPSAGSGKKAKGSGRARQGWIRLGWRVDVRQRLRTGAHEEAGSS